MVFGLQCVLASVVLLSFPIAGRAEDKSGARAAYQAASQHYDLGEYQQALEGFTEAYRNFEDPAFLFNIAQCHRALGHKREAVGFYKSYLRKSSAPDNADEVRKIVADLERATAEESRSSAVSRSVTSNETPRLAVTSSPPPKHSKLWILGVVAGVVIAGAAIGIGVGLGTRSPSAPSVATSAGTFRF